MGSVEKIVDMLNAVVAEGLNDYTQFGNKTKYTKEEVTAKLFETISVRVKAQLDDAFGICTTIKDMLTLHIVSSLLKVSKDHFDTIPDGEELCNINVIQTQTKIMDDIRLEVQNQIKPYVALLGLCNFPEKL